MWTEPRLDCSPVPDVSWPLLAQCRTTIYRSQSISMAFIKDLEIVGALVSVLPLVKSSRIRKPTTPRHLLSACRRSLKVRTKRPLTLPAGAAFDHHHLPCRPHISYRDDRKENSLPPSSPPSYRNHVKRKEGKINFWGPSSEKTPACRLADLVSSICRPSA